MAYDLPHDTSIGALLAVDLGVKTGLALFGPEGRLRWYRSQNFGTAARLRRGVQGLLASMPHLAWLVLEGGGPLADLWTLPTLTEIIYRSNGADYIYAIDDIAEVGPNEVDRLYVKKSDHVLLVTCTAWNYVTETYDGRLVADAVLVKQLPSP